MARTRVVVWGCVALLVAAAGILAWTPERPPDGDLYALVLRHVLSDYPGPPAPDRVIAVALPDGDPPPALCGELGVRPFHAARPTPPYDQRWQAIVVGELRWRKPHEAITDVRISWGPRTVHKRTLLVSWSWGRWEVSCLRRISGEVIICYDRAGQR